MSISADETSSLHEELTSAVETASTETGAITAEPGVLPDPATVTATPALPEFSVPEKWPKAAKEAVQAMLQLPDGTGRKWAESWVEHDKGTRGYITRVEQERAQYRQQWEPLRPILEPLAQQYALQGMDLASGMRQMVGVAQLVAQNPIQGLQYIAKMYGVDLAKAVEQQPYVPPEFSALEQRFAQFEQRQAQTQFQQQQQYKAAVEKSVQDQLIAFESATDATGAPKWPHFVQLQDEMAYLLTAAQVAGKPITLEAAYEKALKLDDKLQAEQAKQLAQADAAKRAAEAARAVGASRTVKARGTGSEPPPMKPRAEELAERLSAAGYN